MGYQLQFEQPDLARALSEADTETIDELPFGVIGLDDQLFCRLYNTRESEEAGLSQERVLGRRFFEDVAPCMNNFLVADRLRDEMPLDTFLDYTLSVRIAPTPVRLRLLSQPGVALRYLVIEWPGKI